MNEHNKPSYTVIKHEPRIKFGLTNNDYCVAALIYHMSNNPYAPIKGWCTAGKETIGGYFGISRQSVHSIVAKLEEKKLVERQPQTGFLKTTGEWYTEFECLTQCKESLHPVKKGDAESKESLQGGVKNLDTDCKESLHNKNTILIEDNNSNNTPAVTSPAKTFEDFWDKYGKKVNKEKCQSKWKKLSNADITKIFEVLDDYVRSTPDVQYRKNPLTYLNNKCWNDEIIWKNGLKPTPKPTEEETKNKFADHQQKIIAMQRGY